MLLLRGRSEFFSELFTILLARTPCVGWLVGWLPVCLVASAFKSKKKRAGHFLQKNARRLKMRLARGRWEEKGVVRNSVQNFFFATLFLVANLSPDQIFRLYYGRPPPKIPTRNAEDTS